MANTDIIIWGATGFVGKLIAEYFAATYNDGSVSWAIGGRNEEKLKAVRDSLGEGCKDLPIIVGDAMDAASLDAFVPKARVIISTVGPYALYGSALLAACARHGVDYVDLTGETQWIMRMLKEHSVDAKTSGARIVNCCGYDSIPSDLGVFFLNSQAKAKGNAPITSAKMALKDAKGGASGGTIWSLMNVVEEASKDKELAGKLRNPFSLVPESGYEGPQQPSDSPLKFDEDFGVWVAPFVMAAINTRIVHRSNALLDYPMGRDFRYGEMMMVGPGFGGRMKAYTISAALGFFMLAAVTPPLRALMKRFLLPKPGEGPSKEARENGYFDQVVVGKTADGTTYAARVTGDMDPGYGGTAKMISEAAMCLLQDVPKSEVGGGLWTPASAMGQKLIYRLEARAGLRFDAEKIAESY